MEECGELFSRPIKAKVRAVVGGDSPLCDPGSDLRLGGRENRRAKAIYAMEKKKLGSILTSGSETIGYAHGACISDETMKKKIAGSTPTVTTFFRLLFHF